jgi:imidazole glycerol phosphate synthase glutamine amidotransferase subunit
MITVVDYGMGNLRNVRRALEHIGCDVLVTPDPEAVRQATTLILPGVGAFGEAVARIDGLGLRAPILEHAGSGKPMLGICLGMQLLFQDSEESPGAAGLGLIPGSIVRFRTTLVVPHIGWNDVRPVAPSILLAPDGGCFYFVHSFHAGATPAAVGTTDYGVAFTSVVEKQNIFGVQFHPEKSQAAGIDLLRRFAAFDKAEVRA